MRTVLLAALATLSISGVAAQGPPAVFVHGSTGTESVVGLRIDRIFEANGPAPRVLLNTGEQTWTAQLERVDVDAAGFRSWVGSIEGIPRSHVIFAERDGIVSGLIDAGGARYEVRTVQPGTYLLGRVHPAGLRGEGEPRLAGSEQRSAAARPFEVMREDGRTIDLLMLYTPAARAQRGGPAHIEALVSQIVSDTNSAFARSGIIPRLRLVGSREVGLVESTQIANDLTRLSTSGDARSLRDLYRADLVQLLVSSPDQTTCGASYLLTSLTQIEFDAYSVADVACAAQYTPTHELGHNFGSHHAPEDDASGALFPYSYGFKDAARGFRTVMAYECAERPCPRVLHFSNPEVMQNGGPTGTQWQNNTQSINQAALTVANFRQAATPAVATAPAGLRSEVNGNTVTVAWEPSSATSYILQVGTAAGTTDRFNQSVGNVTAVSGVVANGTYFWRVIAVTAAGRSAPSAEGQFTVAPPCVSPTAPHSLGFSLNGRVVSLTWAAPARGTLPPSYTVEAGSASGFADLVIASVGETTGVTMSAPPGTYFVRVRAHNACGTSGASNEQVIAVP